MQHPSTTKAVSLALQTIKHRALNRHGRRRNSENSSLQRLSDTMVHCWKNCLCSSPSRKQDVTDPLIPTWVYIFTQLFSTVSSTLPLNLRNALAVRGRNPRGSSTDAQGNILGLQQQQQQQGTSNNLAGLDLQDSSAGEEGTIPQPINVLGPLPKIFEKGLFSLTNVSASLATGTGTDAIEACGRVCSNYRNYSPPCICREPSVDDVKSLHLYFINYYNKVFIIEGFRERYFDIY